MRFTSIFPISLFLISSSSTAEESNRVFCDQAASFASQVAEARMAGEEFVSLIEKVENMDSSSSMKVMSKRIVADVYVNNFSPEEAFLKVSRSCVRSISNKGSTIE